MPEVTITCTTCHSPDVKCVNPHCAIYICNACTCQWSEKYRKPDELPRLQALALEAARIATRKLCERITELEAWNNTLRSDMAGLAAHNQALQTEVARHAWHPASEHPTEERHFLVYDDNVGFAAHADWFHDHWCHDVEGTFIITHWREIVPPESEAKHG